MHALIGNVRMELLLHHIRNGLIDEVHDLHRRVDDAQLLLLFREGVLEELLEKLLDDRLAFGCRLDVLHTNLDSLVEAVKQLRRLLHAFVVELFDHLSHGLGDRIHRREGIIAEESVQNRLRHDVLAKHLDHFIIGEFAVERVLEFGLEAFKRLLGGFAFGKHLVDVLDLLLTNLPHVLGPILPFTAIADLLDDARLKFILEDFVASEVKGYLRLFHALPLLFVLMAFFVNVIRRFLGRMFLAFVLFPALDLLVGKANDFHLGFVDLAKLTVNKRAEVRVNGFEGAKHLPNRVEVLVVVQNHVGGNTGRRHNGNDDIAALLAGRLAHDAPDRLHHVDHRLARGQEQHGVQCGHVHTFGQTADVEEKLADVFSGFSTKPGQEFVLLHGVHRTVDVFAFATQAVRLKELRFVELGIFLPALGDFCGLVVLDDLVEVFGKRHRGGTVVPLARTNDLREAYGSAHRLTVVSNGNFISKVELA